MREYLYEKPPFVEELTFWVKPPLVERYMELEREIWMKDLETLPGFLGGELWTGETGDVTTIYFWESEAAFRGIDPDWLKTRKERMQAAMGPENMRFLRAGHEENPRVKRSEYR